MSAYLLLDDLRQILAQVLKECPSADTSSAADIYLPSLRELEKKLDGAAKAAAAASASTITDVDLAARDAEHDGLARAIWHVCEAYLQLPDAPAELIAAAQRIRAELVSGPDVWTAAYAVEAQQAEDKKVKLPILAADLKLFPVADGDTLEAWAKNHIEAGIQLGKDLAARAAAEAAGEAATSSTVPVLRAQLLKLLAEFRVALTAEVRRKPALAEAATRTFALFDKLSAERQAAGRASARKAKAAKGGAPADGDDA
jgi:hypothetical protein